MNGRKYSRSYAKSIIDKIYYALEIYGAYIR